MEKKYQHAEEKPETNTVSEPTLNYSLPTGIKSSPPLTEEELADSITGEELLEHIYQYIDNL
ncbi:MAG: hypothetical protein LUD02_15945 [Tannerellaceae bacterium]|nr:hypothetical protein [Tannerellaceae bacterium]